jgi:hypothetical protein
MIGKRLAFDTHVITADELLPEWLFEERLFALNGALSLKVKCHSSADLPILSSDSYPTSRLIPLYSTQQGRSLIMHRLDCESLRSVYINDPSSFHECLHLHIQHSLYRRFCSVPLAILPVLLSLGI